MVILIAAVLGFWRMAKTKGLNSFLWAFIALGSYFGTPFMAGVVISLTAPEMLYEEFSLKMVSLVSSLAGLAIAYLFMEYAAKRKKREVKEEDSGVLDDRYLEKL